MSILFSPTWEIRKTWSEAPVTASLDEYLAACKIEVLELFQGSHQEAKMRLNELRKQLFGLDWMNEHHPVKLHLKKIERI